MHDHFYAVCTENSIDIFSIEVSILFYIIKRNKKTRTPRYYNNYYYYYSLLRTKKYNKATEKWPILFQRDKYFISKDV
jgi:hypothetical protein